MSNRWSEGTFTELFESLWQEWNELSSVAFSSWAGAAMACLDYIDVRGKVVLCPSNTFMATPLSVIKAGGQVQFVDCNRHDLCMSYDDFVAKAEKWRPAAVWLVHIGGHIAFDVEKIAAYCRKHHIWLLEDCAHAHGAHWHGKKPGAWGDAGVYSFYATKTISTGEGGMLVTRHEDLAGQALLGLALVETIGPKSAQSDLIRLCELTLTASVLCSPVSQKGVVCLDGISHVIGPGQLSKTVFKFLILEKSTNSSS